MLITDAPPVAKCGTTKSQTLPLQSVIFSVLENVMKFVLQVMIVDLDAHQGNGHERDFMNDGQVYIMDVYNRGIYPHDGFAKRKYLQPGQNHFGSSFFSGQVIHYKKLYIFKHMVLIEHL